SAGTRRATIGACRARMPTSPTVVRVESWTNSPLKISCSGVITWASSLCWSSATSLALLASTLSGVRAYLVDGALHVEVALGEVVVLAVEDLAEAPHRLLHRHVDARAPGEHLRDEERLRQEALDLARPRDGQLVLVGELVDPEDRDDVLELLVSLEH